MLGCPKALMYAFIQCLGERQLFTQKQEIESEEWKNLICLSVVQVFQVKEMVAVLLRW